MIKFRRKDNVDGPEWIEHRGKNVQSDFFFQSFDYSIFGEVFTRKSSEFKKAFKDYLLWRRLSD